MILARAATRSIVELNPRAPVPGVEGTWAHTAEMEYFRRRPTALALIRLLPPRDAHPFRDLDIYASRPAPRRRDV